MGIVFLVLRVVVVCVGCFGNVYYYFCWLKCVVDSWCGRCCGVLFE